MGNEVVWVGALEHEDLNVVVGLGSLKEGDQIADQFRTQKIHRRRRDLREQNRFVPAQGERFETLRVISVLVIDFFRHFFLSYL
jgi:hypothetical protein